VQALVFHVDRQTDKDETKIHFPQFLMHPGMVMLISLCTANKGWKATKNILKWYLLEKGYKDTQGITGTKKQT
jgi:hypothetical protein